MRTPTLRLSKDVEFMVIRLRQATNENAPGPSLKGRVVIDHTTKQAANEYAHSPSRKGFLVNGHTSKASNK